MPNKEKYMVNALDAHPGQDMISVRGSTALGKIVADLLGPSAPETQLIHRSTFALQAR